MTAELLELIWSRSEQHRPVYVGHLRSYSRRPMETAMAWRRCQELGVQVLGALNYAEWRELEKLMATR